MTWHGGVLAEILGMRMWVLEAYPYFYLILLNLDQNRSLEIWLSFAEAAFAPITAMGSSQNPDHIIPSRFQAGEPILTF